MFPVYGRPVASEKFASGIEGEGDVLVRVEALNIAKAEAVAAWDLHSVGKARVGRFNERSVLMCGAELVISQFPKNEKKVVCRRPGGVLFFRKSAGAYQTFFPRSYGVLQMHPQRH